MDVTLNTNYLPITKPNLKSGTTVSGTTVTDTANFAIEKNTEKQFDYSEVMMDLEDLQNFLFMLIGSEIPGTAAGDDKGNKLNLFA
jgi:hypothetical protein